ncbi:MAG: polysaccharide biosynthesis protein [Bacillota bacterium]|nr:polysaccharide biosynthesis protein [Bacillota bacterium]
MKKQSTTKGFAVLSAATIIMKFISLIYVPFLTAIITHEGYGTYAAAYQVFTFIYVVANSGISIAISKIIAEYTAVGNPKDAAKSFKMSRALMMLVGIILGLLMYISANFLAGLTFPQAALSIRFLVPTIMITPVLSVYRGYFQGKRNMTPTAVSQIIEQVMNLIFSLLFAKILIKKGVEWGCAGGTVGTTLGAFAALIYLIILNKKYRKAGELQDVHAKRHSNKYLIRKILKYAAPITICMGLQYAGNLLDTFNITGRLVAAGFGQNSVKTKFADLYYYNTLLNVMVSIISALSSTILPAISGESVLQNRKGIEEKINFAFRVCFFMSIPYAVSMAVLNKPLYSIISFFSGKEGALLLLKGSAVIIFWSVVLIQSTILQGMGKLYSATFNILAGIIFKIITNYILVGIPSINITGAVIGSMICYMIPLILNHFTIKKKLNIEFKLFKYSIKPLIASAGMGVAMYVVNFSLNILLKANGFGSKAAITLLNLAVSGIIGIIVYIIALLFVGGITNNDLNAVPERLKKFVPKFFFTIAK